MKRNDRKRKERGQVRKEDMGGKQRGKQQVMGEERIKEENTEREKGREREECREKK